MSYWHYKQNQQARRDTAPLNNDLIFLFQYLIYFEYFSIFFNRFIFLKFFFELQVINKNLSTSPSPNLFVAAPFKTLPWS